MKNIYLAGSGIGQSMSPIINPGDKIYITKTAPNLLQRGDIIVFFYKKKLISHRIVRIFQDSILTKGDNTASYDTVINKKFILGRVVLVIGRFGNIHLDSKTAHFLKHYYLLCSLVSYYLPRLTYCIVLRMMIGRRMLLKLQQQKRA